MKTRIIPAVCSGVGCNRAAALPPRVADAIARQRESLTARTRSRTAREQAQARKDRGEVPFVKKAG